MKTINKELLIIWKLYLLAKVLKLILIFIIYDKILYMKLFNKFNREGIYLFLFSFI